MIDISIKMPPAPKSPNKSHVDPLTSIPRSKRVNETESEHDREKKKRRKPPQSPVTDNPAGRQDDDPDHPHIDNYA